MCTQDIYKDHEEEEKMSKSMLYIYTHNGYNDAFLKKRCRDGTICYVKWWES